MKWKLTHNTDSLTIWSTDGYELRGRGRAYGGGIRRDWTLWVVREGERNRQIAEPSRLSEGKGAAYQHARANGVQVDPPGGTARRTPVPSVVGGR